MLDGSSDDRRLNILKLKSLIKYFSTYSVFNTHKHLEKLYFCRGEAQTEIFYLTIIFLMIKFLCKQNSEFFKFYRSI